LIRHAIRADIARTGHSLIPLLNAWQKVVSPEAGRYIHFGATTQDIQDTAQSLEIKDVLFILERDTGEHHRPALRPGRNVPGPGDDSPDPWAAGPAHYPGGQNGCVAG
jgi:hypothetical protein